MQVKEITVHYERKVNLGNYQSATIGITLTASIDDDDGDGMTFAGEQKAMDQLQTLARDAVGAEMQRLPRPVEGPSISKPVVASNGPQKAPEAPKAPAVAATPPFQPSGEGGLLI